MKGWPQREGPKTSIDPTTWGPAGDRKKNKNDAEVRQLSHILQYSDNMFMSLMLANLNFL